MSWSRFWSPDNSICVFFSKEKLASGLTTSELTTQMMMIQYGQYGPLTTLQKNWLFIFFASTTLFLFHFMWKKYRIYYHDGHYYHNPQISFDFYYFEIICFTLKKSNSIFPLYVKCHAGRYSIQKKNNINPCRRRHQFNNFYKVVLTGGSLPKKRRIKRLALTDTYI